VTSNGKEKVEKETNIQKESEEKRNLMIFERGKEWKGKREAGGERK
jgi:hypothetical protein